MIPILEKIKGNKKTLTSLGPKVSNFTKNNISLGQFSKLDFENIYNNETIYQAPPWYETQSHQNTLKPKKGPYSLNRSKLRELIKFPQSEDLLNDHKKWKLISISTFVTTIMVPVIFSSVEVGIVHIASFYGGVGLTIYSINKFTNKWHEAIWVYNRENIAAQLDLDKN